MAQQIVELLRYTVDKGASDLHLKAGNVPHVRVHGQLEPSTFPALDAEDTERMAFEIMPRAKAAAFHETSEADFGFEVPDLARFRVNVFRARERVGLSLRLIRNEIPTFDDLNLPSKVKDLADQVRGLVLVTGPAGVGKTTTIASMIGHINRSRRGHIVTMEDPIELLHEDDKCMVDQREIGVDTVSYAEALRHVLRQDPDVIFVGEIRDGDSMTAALQAAETGHLVISTLHTINATETVNRVIDLFPSQHQLEARVSFAGSLVGVLSQRLVPRADGTGRIPACEILVNTGRVYDRILEPESTFQIADVIGDGKFYGMQTFDQHLVALVKEGMVTEEDAKRAASNPHDFLLLLRGELGRGPA